VTSVRPGLCGGGAPAPRRRGPVGRDAGVAVAAKAGEETLCLSVAVPSVGLANRATIYDPISIWEMTVPIWSSPISIHSVSNVLRLCTEWQIGSTLRTLFVTPDKSWRG